VKIDVERCTVGVQRMRIFQSDEDDEERRWRGLDRDSCASRPEVV